MEEKLESFLTLLNKVTTTTSVQDLNEIEERLHRILKEITIIIESNKSPVDDKILTKIDSLKQAIDKIENLNESSSKIFSEFNKFIENRKFK